MNQDSRLERHNGLKTNREIHNINPPEPIELIAIDLDGTLLRSDKTISKSCINAIAEAGRRGVRVVLATARPPRSTRDIAAQLDVDSYVIHYNGALIHDFMLRQHVFHQPMPAGLVREVVDFARSIDSSVVVSLEVLDRWLTDRVDHNLLTETAKEFAPDTVAPMGLLLAEPVTKLMLLHDPDKLNTVAMAVRTEFADKIAMVSSDSHLAQILHPSVDKAQALAWIAAKHSVPQSRVMAIGDAPNDVGMICWAQIGVAVANAWDQVIQCADAVVASNDQDGVAQAINRFVLAPR